MNRRALLQSIAIAPLLTFGAMSQFDPDEAGAMPFAHIAVLESESFRPYDALLSQPMKSIDLDGNPFWFVVKSDGIVVLRDFWDPGFVTVKHSNAWHRHAGGWALFDGHPSYFGNNRWEDLGE